MSETNSSSFPSKFPYRNEFETSENSSSSVASSHHNDHPTHSRKRGGDEMSGEDPKNKKPTGRRGRPVKGTIGDVNGVIGGVTVGRGHVFQDLHFGRKNVCTDGEGQGGQGMDGDLGSATHGQYAAENWTQSTKKPRKAPNTTKKPTARMLKNKKENQDAIAHGAGEDGGRNTNPGGKSEINAMDALFWALEQQEQIKIKQQERDKDNLAKSLSNSAGTGTGTGTGAEGGEKEKEKRGDAENKSGSGPDSGMGSRSGPGSVEKNEKSENGIEMSVQEIILKKEEIKNGISSETVEMEIDINGNTSVGVDSL